MPTNEVDLKRGQNSGPKELGQQKNGQQQIVAMEALVREMESLADPATRAACTHLLQTFMEFHRSAIERVLTIVHGSGETGQPIIDDLGADELAGSLLLLHDVHPLDLRARVLRGLENARSYLQSHGGNVELVDISDSGGVTIRLIGSCHSCPSSALTLQSTVEQSIYAEAPDVTAILVDAETPGASSGFVPLTVLQNRSGGAPSIEPPVLESASERSSV